jgi:dTDP-glucose pyrophosphorylase
MAGRSQFFDTKLFPFPVPLIEVRGTPMIERVVANLSGMDREVRFVFVVKQEDCRRFHLDRTLMLLAPREAIVVQLGGETRGALCSALMAISHINNDTALVIANSDQLFDDSLSDVVGRFRDAEADAGCLFFHSVHPRWSYVRTENDLVVEAAEKDPISRNAVAGFYYFSTGKLFVNAAMRTIKKGNTTDGQYYVAPVFNELVLDGKRVVALQVDSSRYHSFFTPQRIQDYEGAAQRSEN